MPPKKRIIQLWSRDQQILCDLRSYPHTSMQIGFLYFPSCQNPAKTAAARLRKLWMHGLLSRSTLVSAHPQGRGQLVYYIKQKRNLAPLDLDHSLAVVDLRIALARAFASQSSLTHSFSYPKQFYAESLHQIGLIPDAVLQIKHVPSGKEILHFIEVDLSSEPVSLKSSYSFSSKIIKYISYFDSQKYKRDFEEEYKGFRVLVLCPDKKRILSLLKKTTQESADFFWFAAHRELLSDVLGPVWLHSSATSPAPLFTSV